MRIGLDDDLFFAAYAINLAESEKKAIDARDDMKWEKGRAETIVTYISR